MTLIYPRESAEASFGPRFYPGYKSTTKRAPQKPGRRPTHAIGTHRSGLRPDIVREHDNDLTVQPIGERMIVHGQVLDEDGRGVANTLVELWQAMRAQRHQSKTRTSIGGPHQAVGGAAPLPLAGAASTGSPARPSRGS